MPPRTPRVRRRRGASAAAVLVAIAGVATVTTASVIVGPRLLFAGEGAATDSTLQPSSHERQQVLSGLAEIVGQSIEVIAIHSRETAAFDEILLWVADREDPGRINRSELLLISHSRVLQSVSVYQFEPPPPSDLPDIVGLPQDDAPARDPFVDRDAAGSAAFCNTFRADPATRWGVIARGVSDLSLEPERSAPDGPLRLRIVMEWADESDDPRSAADRGAALVDARFGAGAAQETPQ